MSIIPCGHRLLVKPYKQVEVDEVLRNAKEFLKEFKIVKSEGQEKREDASVDKGIVLAIGTSCWSGFGDGSPWCKVGDEILFAKFAGKMVDDPETAETFMLMNDEDVVAIISKKENND